MKSDQLALWFCRLAQRFFILLCVGVDLGVGRCTFALAMVGWFMYFAIRGKSGFQFDLNEFKTNLTYISLSSSLRFFIFKLKFWRYLTC